MTRARSATFDEEFDGVAFVHDEIDVIADTRRIELLAAETPLDEEGAAAAQNAADGEEIEVFARGDEWRKHAILEHQYAQDEIIDVALMAGNEYESMRFRELADAIELLLIDVEPVIDDAPHGHEGSRKDFAHDERKFRCSFIEDFSRLERQFFDRLPRLLRNRFELVLESLGFDDFAQQLLVWFDFGPVDHRMHGVDIVVEFVAQRGFWRDRFGIASEVMDEAEGVSDLEKELP